MSSSEINSARRLRRFTEPQLLGAIGFTAISLTVIFGYAVEHFIDWDFSFFRGWQYWVALALSVLIWLPTYCMLKNLKLETGTLYYLRLQPATFTPLHDPTVTLYSEAARDFRAVRRVFRPPVASQSVVDIVDVTSEVFAEFERSTNDDDDTTLFSVAPDLPWPAAVRLGFDWTARKVVWLTESDATQPDAKVTNWSFDRLVRPLPAADSCPFLRVEEYELPSSPNPVKRVKLALFATAKPDELARSLQGLSPADSGYDRTRVVFGIKPQMQDLNGQQVVVDGEWEETRLRLADRKATADDPAGYSVDGNELVRGLCAHIHDAFRDFPDATIDITAQIPKTVAFALGLALGYYPTSDGPRANLAPLWTRARLLHFLGQGQFRPMLVHPIQARAAGTAAT
ncbi:MAG: hypothetical protein QM662_01555 [Gordonia sp. (in: high G+C Gram-positive bacteria)]